jgi:short-subunit dehydrogenase
LSVPHLLPYSASKFALAGLSKGMGIELAKYGVTVTTVFPGLMRTGSQGNALFKGQNRAENAWFSLGAANPVTAIGAESAARQIVAASRRGDAELVLSLPAKFAAKFNALFPNATADLLALVDHVLPGPGGIGTELVKGKESESIISPSILTRLGDLAALRNNEVG